eukprot:3235488-Pyramimonas_sp.AAC.1
MRPGRSWNNGLLLPTNPDHRSSTRRRSRSATRWTCIGPRTRRVRGAGADLVTYYTSKVLELLWYGMATPTSSHLDTSGVISA